MRWLGIVLVGSFTACYAKPPPNVENAGSHEPSNVTYTTTPVRIAARRPAIDITAVLPDFHEELRWPLTGMNHPSLERRYAIAQQLAAPGIEWQELCARGVQNRTSGTQKELVAYLRGWCAVQKRDVDAACAQLRPLLGSVTAGMSAAVQQDLANILVEQGDADKAEHWLSKHDIRDTRTLDLLAASYIEVGSQSDAFTINRRAIDSDTHASVATTCYRLVKGLVLGLDPQPWVTTGELKKLALDPKVPDPTCARHWNKIACWQDHHQCAAYFTDENVSTPQRLLVDAYDAWPSEAAGIGTWLTYADDARHALPTPGAAELVISALEAARRMDACSVGMARTAKFTLDLVRLDPAEAASYEQRILALGCVLGEPTPPGATPASARP